MKKLITSVLLVFFLMVGIRTFIIEPDSLILEKDTIQLPDWNSSKSLKVAVLSDFHVGKPYITPKKLNKIINIINSQKPDLILLLGDYAPAHIFNSIYPIGPRKQTLDSIKLLGNLKAPLGIISVLGNHDWGFGGEEIRRTLEESGIKVLENNAIPVTANGKKFWIAGLADLWMRRPDIKTTIVDIKDNNPIILLSHNPDVFPSMPQRISLTIAGHTHGEQINLPVIGKALSPSHYGDRYVAGYIVESNKRLFVSTGIGTTGLPGRLRRPPKIYILKISRQD